MIAFGGEPFAHVKTILVEDVVGTGGRALHGARMLAAAGAEVLGVVALLDRQRGAAQRLAGDGFNLRALFTERDLTATTRSGRVPAS
jgi:orotate phosphoribosyltransferase